LLLLPLGKEKQQHQLSHYIASAFIYNSCDDMKLRRKPSRLTSGGSFIAEAEALKNFLKIF